MWLITKMIPSAPLSVLKQHISIAISQSLTAVGFILLVAFLWNHILLLCSVQKFEKIISSVTGVVSEHKWNPKHFNSPLQGTKHVSFVPICSKRENWIGRTVPEWQVASTGLLLKSTSKGHCTPCGLLYSLVLPCIVCRLFPIIKCSLFYRAHGFFLPEFWFL